MAFVKLHCKILDSSLWSDRDAREVFITSLLMASPHVLDHEEPQIDVRTLDLTGWGVPPGSYGFVEAAGVGIIRRAGLETEPGLAALERLCSPEEESGSKDFDGRRLARIDGGYVVLNFAKYRDRDETAAERMRRYRENVSVTRNARNATRNETVTGRNVTHADADADADADAEKKENHPPTPRRGRRERAKVLSEEQQSRFEKFWEAYPKKRAKGDAEKSWGQMLPDDALLATMLSAIMEQSLLFDWQKENGQYIPYPATWLNAKRWTDQPTSKPGNGKLTVDFVKHCLSEVSDLHLKLDNRIFIYSITDKHPEYFKSSLVMDAVEDAKNAEHLFKLLVEYHEHGKRVSAQSSNG